MQAVSFHELDGIGYLRVLSNAVRNDYSFRITAMRFKIENILKWLNAMSAFFIGEQFNQIHQLQFVEKIETVTSESENYFDWNDVSDICTPSASGIYYYLVRLCE